MVKVTHGTTEVEIAKAAAGQRFAVSLSVYNADSASATLTASIYDATSTARIVRKATLDIGTPSVIYSAADPCILEGPERLVVYLAAAPTTQITLHYHIRQGF